MRSLSAAHRLFHSNSVRTYGDAIFYIFRSGKLWELLYFAVLEVHYWSCRCFRIKSKLMEFRNAPFWLFGSSNDPLDVSDLAKTLRLHNFSVAEVSTKWESVAESADGTIFGNTYDRPNVLQRSMSLEIAPIALFEFQDPIVSVFISAKNELFVSTMGAVYRGRNGGSEFDFVLQLSDRKSFVWHNHGIDESLEGLLIGEYGIVVDDNRNGTFWKSVANLYSTCDGGTNWRRIDHLTNGNVKHVHLVRYSQRLARWFITDGDKHKLSYWFGRIDEIKAEFFKSAKFCSLFDGGGHTAFAETREATFLGTDYNGGSNSILCVRSTQDMSAEILPAPYRRSPVLNMCSVTSTHRSLVFAWLHSGLRDKWKSAIIYTDDNGASWNRLIEYNGAVVSFAFCNGQRTASSSLLISFHNRTTNERRTLILSVCNNQNAA